MKTKIVTCPDCKRPREVSEDTVLHLCPCGNTLNLSRNALTMKDITKDGQFSNTSDQVILKDLFQIGVERGRPITMDEWLEDLDTSIKVNLK